MLKVQTAAPQSVRRRACSPEQAERVEGRTCRGAGKCIAPANLPDDSTQLLLSAYVFEVDRLTVDATLRRRDVVGELARLEDRLHLQAT
jgi:hypothetical protein